MKTADIKVGEWYRWQRNTWESGTRAQVVETGLPLRTYGYSRRVMSNGIRIKYELQGTGPEEWFETVVPSREITEEWESYRQRTAEERRRRDASEKARLERREKVLQLAADLDERLVAKGIPRKWVSTSLGFRESVREQVERYFKVRDDEARHRYAIDVETALSNFRVVVDKEQVALADVLALLDIEDTRS